jgi:hypothetical protein
LVIPQRPGDLMRVQAPSPIEAIAARILGSIRAVTEKRASAWRMAPSTAVQ